MKYLTTIEVMELHQRTIAQSGGGSGIRDLGGVQSAVAQPQMTFGGVDLYPTLAEKAAALCYSLVMNHPFIDGNKRIGFVAMGAFLVVNGFALNIDDDDGERTIFSLAAGTLSREELLSWINAHLVPYVDPDQGKNP